MIKKCEDDKAAKAAAELKSKPRPVIEPGSDIYAETPRFALGVEDKHGDSSSLTIPAVTRNAPSPAVAPTSLKKVKIGPSSNIPKPFVHPPHLVLSAAAAKEVPQYIQNLLNNPSQDPA